MDISHLVFHSGKRAALRLLPPSLIHITPSSELLYNHRSVWRHLVAILRTKTRFHVIPRHASSRHWASAKPIQYKPIQYSPKLARLTPGGNVHYYLTDLCSRWPPFRATFLPRREVSEGGGIIVSWDISILVNTQIMLAITLWQWWVGIKLK